MKPTVSTSVVVDHLFRHEAGKMVSVLTRIFGTHNLELAEDVVQEAFLKAVQTWKYGSLPENPAAWLMLVAKNKALDIIRRKQHFRHLSAELAGRLNKDTGEAIEHFFLDTEIADSQLQMIFACCHPSLNQEDQLAITLKTASGFGVAEIAKALVTTEAVIKKRLYRAKQFIKANELSLDIPGGLALLQRLESVYAVLYLLFNEGYNSMKADELIRRDLCAEAMRLCLLLGEHRIGKEPATFALLSLMCFHASRFDARLDGNREIIILAQQDRSAWNATLIEKGFDYLSQASTGAYLSVYHLEAAIAAEYARAGSFEETNWKQLLGLYDMLVSTKQMPVVLLNRAIVLSQLGHVHRAIEEILAIADLGKILESQYIYNAVLGDLFCKTKQYEKARHYLAAAHILTTSEAEKILIAEKMNAIL